MTAHPPRDQDNAAPAPTPPRHGAFWDLSASERLSVFAGHYPADLAGRILALGQVLPAEHRETLASVLHAVACASEDDCGHGYAEEWAAVDAHLPGLATMLGILREHITAEPPDCDLCQATRRARLARLGKETPAC